MNQERPFKERRKFVRLKAIVEVKYVVIGKPGQMKVFSKNVSAGGLCILMEERLDKDTPLQLHIKIPDLKEPIRALGRVVWQQESDQPGKLNTGVEFVGISDFDRFNINRYVMGNIEQKPEDNS